MRWNVLPPPPAEFLAGQHHPTISRLLYYRGLTTQSQIEAFLDPHPSRLTSYRALIDMAPCLDRIQAAISAGEKVAVYGDYDVDGVCSVTLMASVLSDYLPDLVTYIPDRETEGYGLNAKAVESLADQGVTLLISVDCGTSNVSEITLAQSLGMDTIVIDHHEITAQLPPAVAVVNPNRQDDLSACNDLCAAGVVFKVLEGLRERLGFSYAHSPLDLVTLATIADVVPLLGENRVLTTLGLKRIETSRRPGLRALIDVAGTKAITPYAIGFQLGPRLNAAGRMAHADRALALLQAEEAVEARTLGAELDKLNTERRADTQRVLKQAQMQMEEQGDRFSYILSSPEWPVGLVGLVAGKLAEANYRPTLLIAEQGETSRGSARSIPEIDITAMLAELRDLFLHFGGHAQAAGFEILTARIPEFRERLDRLVRIQLGELPPEPTLLITEMLRVEQLNLDLYEELRRMEPFGQSNERPVFGSANVRLTELRAIGGDQTHLKAKLQTPAASIDLIGFGLADRIPQLVNAAQVDIAYTIELNEWNGSTRLQLSLKDLRLP